MTYVRWGMTECPNDTTLVYAGIAAGTKYEIKGGTSNTLCMPENPEYMSEQTFMLQAAHSMAWSMIQITVHFNTFTRPTCPAHSATRMRRQLPSCIQHDSLAHRDGMRSTVGTWQLNYSMPLLRNKTQSVWIRCHTNIRERC